MCFVWNIFLTFRVARSIQMKFHNFKVIKPLNGSVIAQVLAEQ